MNTRTAPDLLDENLRLKAEIDLTDLGRVANMHTSVISVSMIMAWAEMVFRWRKSDGDNNATVECLATPFAAFKLHQLLVDKESKEEGLPPQFTSKIEDSELTLKVSQIGNFCQNHMAGGFGGRANKLYFLNNECIQAEDGCRVMFPMHHLIVKNFVTIVR